MPKSFDIKALLKKPVSELTPAEMRRIPLLGPPLAAAPNAAPPAAAAKAVRGGRVRLEKEGGAGVAKGAQRVFRATAPLLLPRGGRGCSCSSSARDGILGVGRRGWRGRRWCRQLLLLLLLRPPPWRRQGARRRKNPAHRGMVLCVWGGRDQNWGGPAAAPPLIAASTCDALPLAFTYGRAICPRYVRRGGDGGGGK